MTMLMINLARDRYQYLDVQEILEFTICLYKQKERTDEFEVEG